MAKPWPTINAPLLSTQQNLPVDASVKNVGGPHYHGGHPKNTAPVKMYRIIRGQYARREFTSGGDPDGVFVHYSSKNSDHINLPDTLAMTEREADRFGRAFLIEVSSGGIEKPSAAQIAYIAQQAKARVSSNEKDKE